MSRTSTKTLLIVLVAALVGCGGDDPVNYSKPVALNLKAKSGDATAGAVSSDKAITTESGNPYGAFINEANAKLGKAPSTIKVSSMDLLLSTTSTGVTALNEVFDGRVDVQIVMSDTNNTYPVGHATINASTEGRGPLSFSIDFDSAQVAASVDWQKFLGGSFKVVIAGPAAASFVGKKGDADLQLSITFAAYE